MNFIPTTFRDAWIIEPVVHQDERGFFFESFSQKKFSLAGLEVTFVQENHSLSRALHVLRGLHFQMPPFSQAKLVRIIQGAVLDVIVDLRTHSSTYLQWEAFELSRENFRMLFVPRGFAHGFCTLVPDTEMLYSVDNFYSAEHDAGILWQDPQLAIPWPVDKPVISDKDSRLPTLNNFTSPF